MDECLRDGTLAAAPSPSSVATFRALFTATDFKARVYIFFIFLGMYVLRSIFLNAALRTERINYFSTRSFNDVFAAALKLPPTRSLSSDFVYFLAFISHRPVSSSFFLLTNQLFPRFSVFPCFLSGAFVD